MPGKTLVFTSAVSCFLQCIKLVRTIVKVFALFPPDLFQVLLCFRYLGGGIHHREFMCFKRFCVVTLFLWVQGAGAYNSSTTMQESDYANNIMSMCVGNAHATRTFILLRARRRACTYPSKRRRRRANTHTDTHAFPFSHSSPLLVYSLSSALPPSPCLHACNLRDDCRCTRAYCVCRRRQKGHSILLRPKGMYMY